MQHQPSLSLPTRRFDPTAGVPGAGGLRLVSTGTSFTDASTLAPAQPRPAAGACPARDVADAAVAIWRGVHGTLFPIIGQRGVGALYQRSLRLLQGVHPWLSEACDTTQEGTDVALLHEALSRQSAATAQAANSALLQTFCDVLSSLIGASLTDRLLCAGGDLARRDPANHEVAA